MGEQNPALIEYFKGRSAYCAEPNYNPARLSRYVQ